MRVVSARHQKEISRLSATPMTILLVKCEYHEVKIPILPSSHYVYLIFDSINTLPYLK